MDKQLASNIECLNFLIACENISKRTGKNFWDVVTLNECTCGTNSTNENITVNEVQVEIIPTSVVEALD